MPGQSEETDTGVAIDRFDIDLRAVTGADARDLLTAARTDWTRPIPHCPEWDAAHLVGHLGGIFAWMTRIVSTGRPVARQDRETPPGSPEALPSWYLGHLDDVLDILTDTPPDAPTWTFTTRGETQVGWWRRRLAVETAIHRWDVEHAANGPQRPLDDDVAAAGIDEFLTEFLPGLLANAEPRDLAGVLYLQSTNERRRWSIDLDARGDAQTMPGPAAADTVLRATTSDLLLWLTNREPHRPIEVPGRTDVLSGWRRLNR